MRMLHGFKRSQVHFGTAPVPVTPYQKAAQIWDERMGSARVQAKNWRLMAIATLGLLIAQGAGMLWLAGQSRVTPYVVEVDTSGRVRAVGAALVDWHPNDAQIGQALARFITQTRSLSSDPIVVRQNWLEAYNLVTRKAAVTLSAWAAANDPFAQVGRKTITVEIISVVRAGPTSFELRWKESRFEQGRWMGDAEFTAMLGILLQTPATEEAIRKNPLGLYIDHLNWSKDHASGDNRQLQTPAASSPARAAGAPPELPGGLSGVPLPSTSTGDQP